MIKNPTGSVDGIDLTKYVLGRVYTVAPSLAGYLVTEGFAIFEIRDDEHPPSSPESERRKG